jgi:hypothetical protein
MELTTDPTMRGFSKTEFQNVKEGNPKILYRTGIVLQNNTYRPHISMNLSLINFYIKVKRNLHQFLEQHIGTLL